MLELFIRLNSDDRDEQNDEGAATWQGGAVLRDPGAGRIAVGGPALFTLVHGDPLADPAALWRVWRVV